jgi:hypothetical protein
MNIPLSDFTFGLGIATTVAQGVAAGTVHLTGMIPADWIPGVTAWMSFIAFVNVAVLTGLTKMSAPPRDKP